MSPKSLKSNYNFLKYLFLKFLYKMSQEVETKIIFQIRIFPILKIVMLSFKKYTLFHDLIYNIFLMFCL